MRMRAPALALTGVLALGGVAACSDDEQAEVEQTVEDGAETVQDGAEDVGETIDENVDTEGGG